MSECKSLHRVSLPFENICLPRQVCGKTRELTHSRCQHHDERSRWRTRANAGLSPHPPPHGQGAATHNIGSRARRLRARRQQHQSTLPTRIGSWLCAQPSSSDCRHRAKAGTNTKTAISFYVHVHSVCAFRSTRGNVVESSRKKPNSKSSLSARRYPWCRIF